MNLLCQNDAIPEAATSEVGKQNILSSNSTPVYPAHNTQAARLLAVLLRGGQVNPLYGWRALGIYRLSDTAFRLRGTGWPVITDRLDVENRFCEECHVALYRLPQESLTAAGEVGQAFAAEEIRLMSKRRVA